MRGCGVVVIAEMHTNLGRADLVVAYMGKTWVIELKVAFAGENPAIKAETAYSQMVDNNCAQSYLNAICIAIVIDDTARQITEFRV